MEHPMQQSPDRALRASERGFTLVELMVVVAIIALLAAIIIPNYVHSRAQASVAESEANMKQIATALELYYADNQAYPGTSGPVTPTIFATANNAAASNPYLSSTPTNALGHGLYTYTFIGGTGNVNESYTIEDPGPYQASTMTAIPMDPAAGTGTCTACTTLWYSPQAGIYGR